MNAGSIQVDRSLSLSVGIDTRSVWQEKRSLLVTSNKKVGCSSRQGSALEFPGIWKSPQRKRKERTDGDTKKRKTRKEDDTRMKEIPLFPREPSIQQSTKERTTDTKRMQFFFLSPEARSDLDQQHLKTIMMTMRYSTPK